jgi:hypothetical protein
MKSSLLTTLSMALLISGLAWSQDRSQPVKTMSESVGVRQMVVKSILLSGRVSNDGRRFLIDSDNEWDVSNAKVLRGHEGSLVTVKCYVDSSRNQIQIVSVNRVQPEFR